MDIIQALTQELQVEKWQIEAAVKLIDEGNTIPFISRYRKEATGSLNDEILRNLHERLLYLRNLEDKKKQVLSSIEEQGKLTEELKKSIWSTDSGSCRRSVPPVPSEEKNQSNDRQRERAGTSGQSDPASDDRQVHRRRSGKLCI
mgnify:CR=1 FL=1